MFGFLELSELSPKTNNHHFVKSNKNNDTISTLVKLTESAKTLTLYDDTSDMNKPSNKRRRTTDNILTIIK